MRNCLVNFAVALAAAAMTTGACGAPITFFGSGSAGTVSVTASAIFDITGNTLTITLQNTSPINSGNDVPGSTLTGLFWDFTGNPALSPVSATIPSGSSLVQGSNCVSGAPPVTNAANCTSAQTNVGGEFGYQATALTGGADRGIASSGYLSTGLTGNLDNFNGNNLDNPVSLDGINFGIISSFADFSGNGGTQSVPLIDDTVVFVLTGVSGLTNTDISNVSFQYGTSLTELNVPGIDPTGDPNLPEPGTLSLLGAAILGGLFLNRRRQVNA